MVSALPSGRTPAKTSACAMPSCLGDGERGALVVAGEQGPGAGQAPGARPRQPAVGRNWSATTSTARACPAQPIRTAVLPLSSAASAASQARRERRGTAREQPRLPTVTSRPAARPRTPPPGSGTNSVTGGRSPNRAAGLPRDRLADGVLGGVFDRAGEQQRLVGLATARGAAGSVMTPVTAMVPAVRVPVLSSTTTRTRRASSSARALFTRMPSSAPRPTEATSAAGIARPSAHGQATTRTATAALQPCAAGRPVPSQKPSVATARVITQGHEDGGDPVGEPLRARLARLRPRDEAGDLGEQGVRADAGGADDEAAAHVHGGAGHLVALADLDRHGLAGDKRGVDGRASLGDDAVGGDLLPRADHEKVPGGQFGRGHPVLGTVAQHRDGLDAECGQGGKRGGRAVPGAASR